MKREIIGEIVEIKNQNKTFKGKIIDETKNLICLKTQKSTKKLLKNSIKIKIQGLEIEGKKINKRPEERIKTC